MAVVLVAVLGAEPARATPTAGEAGDAVRPVTIVLVRDLTWRTAPSSLDRFAKANLSMPNAPPRSAAEDTYVTLGKGNRSGSLLNDSGAIVAAAVFANAWPAAVAVASQSPDRTPASR